MKDESKPSRKSGSAGSTLTVTQTMSEDVRRTVRLRSKLESGGEHPGTASYIPPAVEIFEAPRATAEQLVACGLAEFVKGE